MTLPSNTRLNKRLVELGLADSRRKADIAIDESIVMVNGEIAQKGTLVKKSDHITLSGSTGSERADISIIFYKPIGYVCTHLKNGRSKTIFELLPKSFGTLKIAGRLDKNSQGLMLLSSDGQFVNTITHPSSGKDKEYLVTLNIAFKKTDTNKLLDGVKLEDGMSRFIKVTIITPQKLRVVLGEGRKRQIRRTLNALGYKVVGLERTRIGKVSVGTLRPGKYRFLTNSEIKEIT